MFKISNLSEGLTEIIRKNIPMDDIKAEQIEYGIYMTISEVLKLTVIIIISALLDILRYSALAIVVFGIHRGFIGGVHAKTHWGCVISYSAIIFGTVYCSMYLPANKFLMCLVFYPICMLIAYRYAPADTDNKPVVSKRQIRRLRTLGFIFITLVFIFAAVTPQPYSNILIIITVVNCISMLPIVYIITGNKYGRKEVNTYVKKS